MRFRMFMFYFYFNNDSHFFCRAHCFKRSAIRSGAYAYVFLAPECILDPEPDT